MMLHRAAFLAVTLALCAGPLAAQISIPKPPPEPEPVDPEVAAAELAAVVETLAPVEESVGFSYFLVQGTTLEVLDEVMKDKGATTMAGQNVWNVSYGLEPCTVKMSATISLPKLIGKAKVADEDLVVWDEMLVAAEAYQREHIAIAQEAATDVRGRNCASEEDGGIEGVIATYRAKSVELDESTKNGATVGVTLIKPDS